jgi:DNA-binding GntR family transcriptional regulator
MTTQANPADPVERSVLSEQVKDRLLQQIVKGERAPGSRIIETKVAKEFGTSQAPVREALRALASLGLVEVRPHRGAWVRQPTTQELVEAVEVRGVLEAFAAEQAAKTITPKCISTLEGLIDEMIALAESGDPHEQAMKNAEFHATIIDASGNKTLERTWELLEPFSQTYLTASIPGIDLMWLAERHNELLDALRDGDPGRAAVAARKHLQEAAEMRSGAAPPVAKPGESAD